MNTLGDWQMSVKRGTLGDSHIETEMRERVPSWNQTTGHRRVLPGGAHCKSQKILTIS
jgi:hypothetical protein